MIKNILNVNGVKALTKTEQDSILGGTTVKIVCDGGNVISGDVPNCHCHNLMDGIYLVMFPDDGTDNYRTYSVIGKEIVDA